MATARIVKSLAKLRDQVNKLAPKRNKASDGWLGDAKHSMRKSDHNPEPDGTVDALDITHDPKNGVDIERLGNALIASRDPRISYLIFNGKIVSGTGGKQPWKKRNYSGPNKHTKHIHVSVKDAGQDDASPWKIDSAFTGVKPAPAPVPKPAPAPAPVPKPAPAPAPVPKPAPAPAAPVEQPLQLTPELITQVQTRLKELGYTEVGGVDGVFGKFTRTAIVAFRLDNHLPISDKIDRELLAKMASASPRVIDQRRETATPKVVVEKVPEAHTNWWNKIVGKFGTWALGGTGVLSGLLEYTGAAKERLEPMREFFAEIPTAVWLIMFAVVCFVIWRNSQKVETKSVEAFRDGSRR
jgi:hypothetical protein